MLCNDPYCKDDFTEKDVYKADKQVVKKNLSVCNEPTVFDLVKSRTC